MFKLDKKTVVAWQSAQMGQPVIVIRPQNLLEVVVVNNSRTIKWRKDSTICPLKLVPIRVESYQYDGLSRRRKGNFSLDIHTYKENLWQHHFWFRIDPKSWHTNSSKAESRNFFATFELTPLELTTLNFIDEDEKNVYELKVKLRATEKDKSEYFRYLNETLYKEIDPLSKDANYSGIGGRVVDTDRGYLFNPSTERVSFRNNQRSMILELPVPKTQFGQWKAIVNSRDNIEVYELAPRIINDIVIQRFLVKNLMVWSSVPIELGKLRLTVLDQSTCNTDRTLSFYIGAKNNSDFYQGDTGDEHRDTGTVGTELATNINDFVYGIRQTTVSVDKPKTKRTKIVISEIECDNNLEYFASVVKLKTIKKKISFDDVQDGQQIMLPSGSDLSITMNRIENGQSSKTWGIEVGGVFLKIDYTLPDGKKCHFSLSEKENSQHRGTFDWIRFRWNSEVRTIQVQRLPKKWAGESKDHWLRMGG